MNERVLSPSRLTVAVVSQAMAGCLCLVMPLFLLVETNAPFPPSSVTAEAGTTVADWTPSIPSPSLFAALGFGLAAGWAAARWLLLHIRLAAVWSGGLLLAAGSLMIGRLLDTSGGTAGDWTSALQVWGAGFAAALIWKSGEQATLKTVPNRNRSVAMASLAAAFSGGALWLCGAAIIQVSTGLSALLVVAGTCVVLCVGVVMLFPRLTAAPLPDPESLREQAAASQTCCDHDHDHDHDETAGRAELVAGAADSGDPATTPVSCGVTDCCGGATACSTSVWIGMALASAGWLFLLGPVNHLLMQRLIWSASPSEGMLSTAGEIDHGLAARMDTNALLDLAAHGVAVLVINQAYWAMVRQTGHTLALPLFLLMESLLALLILATGDSGSGRLLSVMMAGTSFACMSGCLSQVADYFEDIRGRWIWTTAMVAGGGTAGGVLLIISLFPPALQVTVLARMLPIALAIVAVLAMRGIRQPMLVTRFAERILAKKLQSGRS